MNEGCRPAGDPSRPGKKFSIGVLRAAPGAAFTGVAGIVVIAATRPA